MKYLILFLALIITCYSKAQVGTKDGPPTVHYLTMVNTPDNAKKSVVKASDSHIRYSGRIAFTDSTAMLSWSGSSVKINFIGDDITFDLRDEGENYFTEILDGKVISGVRIPKNIKRQITVYGLGPGSHTFELFKRTEWAMGKTWFYDFKLDSGAKILEAPAEPKRKIEIFGNSISCGYAVLDTEGKDRGSAPFEDGYKSYAALTARHYNAEFHNTSKSGIGITISWFPLIMPEMYDRLDATDSTSKWDFSKYTPQLVIINLFQNDSWLVNMPDNPNFKARFGTTAPPPDYYIAAYRKFVASVRGKYPKAKIVCILGSMDATKAGAPWPGYIQQAVDGLHDKYIYTHMIPYKNTPGHPSAKEQQAMADDLEAFLDKNVKW